MVTVRCLLLACLLYPAAWPQNPAALFQKAPPDVEQALRERVTAFLQAHVDGKFRLADQYVADDSKDAFFEAHKRRYRDFEIVKITYSENYTKAVVLAVCGTEMQLPMNSQPLPVKMPLNTYWKIVDGKWFWYLPPAPSSYETPFGKMKPGPEAPGAPGAPSSPPVAIGQGPTLAQLSQLATIDRSEVSLAPANPTAVVTVTNKLPGRASVHIEGAVPEGLEATLDRTELDGSSSARLTLKLADASKLTSFQHTIRLRVDPLNKVFAIRVTVSLPAAK